MSEPRLDRVRVSGPLVSFADGFGAELLERGYSLRSARSQLEFIAQLSRWMSSEGLDVGGLSPRALGRFLAERRQSYATEVSTKRLGPLLDYLGGLGVLPAARRGEPTSVDRILEDFRRYLFEERGLARGSIELYAGVARRFLEERLEPLADDLARLSGQAVNAFVLRESRRVKPRTAETVVCTLRALLRFLHVQGLVRTSLAETVPSVPQRREGLPRGIPVSEVTLLLDSCDRSTTVGRRDFAILMLITRLGLRCGEVAGLRLDELDWRAGEIVIRGKRSRTDRLPLPCDAGEALADYLRQARRPGFGPTVFLRSQAPITGLSGDGVSEVVHRAAERAGVPPLRAHRLRHTIATELLRRGASLPEIGQVLRHQSIETTAVYAKVDRDALGRLALPWPGSRS
jgi:integrase/recombinase XerD